MSAQKFPSTAFSSEACPALDAGWRTVRLKKTRQNNNQEFRFDAIETGL
jgi:hypothetical protein